MKRKESGSHNGGVAILGSRHPRGWEPTFPLTSEYDALDYGIRVVETTLNRAGAKERVHVLPNVDLEEQRLGIHPATRVVFDRGRGVFSFEIVVLPSIRLARVTVTQDGFVNRDWIEDKKPGEK